MNWSQWLAFTALYLTSPYDNIYINNNITRQLLKFCIDEFLLSTLLIMPTNHCSPSLVVSKEISCETYLCALLMTSWRRKRLQDDWVDLTLSWPVELWHRHSDKLHLQPNTDSLHKKTHINSVSWVFLALILMWAVNVMQRVSRAPEPANSESAFRWRSEQSCESKPCVSDRY